MSVTFLGVATLLVDDGGTALLTDGFFSRPSLARVALRRIAPDADRITAGLSRAGAGAGRIAAVLPVHTHYDHAQDAAVVAERTGAVLAGGRSAAHIGHGLPRDQVRVVGSGDRVRFGAFDVTWIESAHCPPDRFPGPIDGPVVPPVRVRAYRCGEAWSLLVAHDGGRTALIQGSAGFVPGSLSGKRAEVAYLGVGQLGRQDETYLRRYWAETVETVGARSVVLIHWDDFFRPLDRPLRALPYVGDDLDATMRIFGSLARDQGVGLYFPTPGRREDPWA